MHSNSQKVCVVIPCYRTPLLGYEVVALDRCARTLSNHDIVIVTPEGLDVNSLLLHYPDLRTESFANQFFKDIGGYNRLMLSDMFYERFAKYEYMLIHQLDAFVFDDQLLAWCAKDYDYVGAPWLPNSHAPNSFEDIYFCARRTLYRWTDREHRTIKGAHQLQYMYSAGNGGFSLRRIETMRKVLRLLPALAEQYRRIDQRIHNEDLFFCVEANRYLPRVKRPGYREAAGFAWELQPAVAAVLNDGRLPFGCHGWNNRHREEWRPIFKRLGYSLDDILDQRLSGWPPA